MERNQECLKKTATYQDGRQAATKAKLADSGSMKSAAGVNSMIRFSTADLFSGRFRTQLYRFLSDSVPAVSACLWTWARLAAAPGKYQIVDGFSKPGSEAGLGRLSQPTGRIYDNGLGVARSMESFLPDLFMSLFRDGLFGGFLTIKTDGSGVDRFIPVDSIDLGFDRDRNGLRPYLENDSNRIWLDRPDFYLLPFDSGKSRPLGRSILQPIPFVSYIEQQLIDDMRRSSHNAGFHRLHVKVSPPERISGESDQGYVERINTYFDSTVSMIKSCDVDDNPVTWDNIEIEHIGPSTARSNSASWFLNHRAMIEEICSGTNLAPFLLGYSYGATTTWSGFKFDIVMRQVRTVQAEIARFLEWIGNIDLALAGYDMRCKFVFDNSFAYKATECMNIENSRVDNVLKLYQAGLIDEETARQRAGELI